MLMAISNCLFHQKSDWVRKDTFNFSILQSSTYMFLSCCSLSNIRVEIFRWFSKLLLLICLLPSRKVLKTRSQKSHQVRRTMQVFRHLFMNARSVLIFGASGHIHSNLLTSHFPNIQFTQPRRIWLGQTKKKKKKIHYTKRDYYLIPTNVSNIEETQILLATKGGR